MILPEEASAPVPELLLEFLRQVLPPGSLHIQDPREESHHSLGAHTHSFLFLLL